MSRTRQPAAPHVRTSSVVCASGYTWRGHTNRWGQLIFAPRGMVTVHDAQGSWVVPPHQALWVPPQFAHDVTLSGRVPLRTLYVHPALDLRLPRRCRRIQVTPLLAELLRRIMRLGTLDRRRPKHRLLLDLAIAEFTTVPVGPVDLRVPTDPRARRAAELLRVAASPAPTLAEVARECGASARTLERLFVRETGLSFGSWRQRARMLRALEVLASGGNVSGASTAAGYASTSAFVAAFRRVMSVTPGRYFRTRTAPEVGAGATEPDGARRGGIP